MSRAEICPRLPHAGAMCLLETVDRCDETGIRCTAISHLDPGNPLLRAGRLWAVCALEYAAQAMALHLALRSGDTPRAGFLGEVRELGLHAERLDLVPGPLSVEASRVLGDGRRAIYRFGVAAGGLVLVTGRASVFIDDPAVDDPGAPG
jgi:predicted hotdog family 3-hydroxylacyl-ACP dehydratase